jgi:hypothetical protein
MNKAKRKQRTYIGIVLVALGVLMTTTLPSVKAVGIVLIAIGGGLVLMHLLGLDEKR